MIHCKYNVPVTCHDQRTNIKLIQSKAFYTNNIISNLSSKRSNMIKLNKSSSYHSNYTNVLSIKYEILFSHICLHLEIIAT